MVKPKDHRGVVMMHKIVNKSILVLLLSVLISGCCSLRSPVKRYDCQFEKAEEKIVVLTRKFPELKQKADTIIISDTIKLPEISVDTTFVFNEKIKLDTIIIEKEKLKIQYVKKDSIIYLSGECKEDTIYIEKEIPIERIVVKESEHPFISYKTKWWLLGVLAIVITTLIIRKKIKNIF